MHETRPGNDSPRERLISLLSADFTLENTTAPPAEDNALAEFLAHAQSIDEIDARLASEENIELGEAVERLLESAPITASFKGFISHEVRQAHAWQDAVVDAVSPKTLGLVNGDGIFDPAQAESIEGRVLRGFLFDIIHRHTIGVTIEDETEKPQLFLMGNIRPDDYAKEVDRIHNWTLDYQEMYGKDPFDGLDQEIYLDATGRIAVPKQSGMAELVRQLRQLGQGE